jgi:hypothetical protein
MVCIEPIDVEHRLVTRCSHAVLGHDSDSFWACAVFGEYCAFAHVRGVSSVLVKNVTTVYSSIRRSVY